MVLQVLQRQYLAMRSQSYLGQPSGTKGGSIPVTTRNLESLIRLSQARAKMELRDFVSEIFNVFMFLVVMYIGGIVLYFIII